MKKKIIGIFVCMLLIATTLVSATKIDFKDDIGSLSNTADVPVWEEGDSWTYEYEQITRGLPNETTKLTITGNIVYTVVDDTGDHYTLEGKGESMSATANLGNVRLKSSRIFNLRVDMVVRKTDLGISSFYYKFKTFAFIMLGPIIIPFPIQGTGYRNTEFTPERPILPFPLHDGKNGTFTSVQIDEEWAQKMFWGLITLEEGNVSWDSVALKYICNTEEITVPAGTYDVYNVTSYLEGWNHIGLCYNATVGNAVEIYVKMFHGEYHDWWMILKHKLKSTTYIP
jgi:hypothetical protein